MHSRELRTSSNPVSTVCFQRLLVWRNFSCVGLLLSLPLVLLVLLVLVRLLVLLVLLLPRSLK